MGEITGVVEDLQERKSKNNDKYVLVSLGGEPLFDWDRHVERANLSIGDEVLIEFDHESEYPRIQRLQKLQGSEAEKHLRKAKDSSGNSRRESHITRTSALKIAATLLENIEMGYEKKVQEAIKLGERLEQWILR